MIKSLNYSNNDSLVDIRDVSVDKSLPDDERPIEYLRQIKNPYHFKCGKYSIRAKYDENGPSLADSLRRLATL